MKLAGLLVVALLAVAVLASPSAVASADVACDAATRLSTVLAFGVEVAKQRGADVSSAELHLEKARKHVEAGACDEAMSEVKSGLRALRGALRGLAQVEVKAGRAWAVERFLEKSRMPEEVKAKVREKASAGVDAAQKLLELIQERQQRLLAERYSRHFEHKLGLSRAEADNLTNLLVEIAEARGAISVLKGLHGLATAYASVAVIIEEFEKTPGKERVVIFGVIAWVSPDNKSLIIVGFERPSIPKKTLGTEHGKAESPVPPDGVPASPPIPRPPPPELVKFILRAFKVDISEAKMFGEPAVGATALVSGVYAGVDQELGIPLVKADMLIVRPIVIMKPLHAGSP